MSGFTVDPEGLSGNAPLYGAAADDVAAIHATLAAKLDAEGACWGNDEAGNALAAKYVGPALAALRTMVDTQHDQVVVHIYDPELRRHALGRPLR